MSSRKDTRLARTGADPFGLLRQMTSEVDRVFDQPFWGAFRRPLQSLAAHRFVTWSPGVDVFEKNGCLVTKVDLPGLKKEDVTVEVTDGHLVIEGERKSETEETKDSVYRCEREYGRFYRAVPLPEGVTLEDIKASCSDGVLEVAVPLPAKPEAKSHRVEIEGAKADTTAA
jgi:HSP20 family protein